MLALSIVDTHSVEISRFYVKSILENLELLNLTFFTILAALKMIRLVNFSLQMSKIHKKSKFRAYQFVGIADFAFQESSKSE